MRVTINTGYMHEEQHDLAKLLTDSFDGMATWQRALGKLLEMLVEKGVLTLADCQALGAPHMEPAP